MKTKHESNMGFSEHCGGGYSVLFGGWTKVHCFFDLAKSEKLLILIEPSISFSIDS